MAKKEIKSTSATNIQDIYSEIKAVLEAARTQAYRTVNFIMVEAYWNIGKTIVKEELKGAWRAGYGEFLIAGLSKKLTKEFGKGFDPSNLWYMRQFYITFPILDALRRELTWTHYRHLLKMDFYINWYEDNERGKSDNPTIGLILCSEKNDAVVKYSVKNSGKNLFASRYRLYLPSEKELQAELKRERAIVESQAYRMGSPASSSVINAAEKRQQ